MDEESANSETQVEPDGYLSPLGIMGVEMHEIYLELKRAGFTDAVLSQIIAHMITDAVVYRDGYDSSDEDEDEDDEFYDGDGTEEEPST